MTGFGAASFEVEGQRFAVEIRSVNHRYLDVQVRLPRALGKFEGELRAELKGRFARGRFDVVVAPPAGAGSLQRVRIDAAVVAEYVSAAAELQRSQPVAGGLDLAALLSLPGVASFVEAELSEEALRTALARAVDAAAGALDAMRGAEGKVLAQDLRARLDRVEELAAALEARAGDVRGAVRERLRRRLAELAQELGGLDEARAAQEIALAVERLDVTEELVRLRSHAAQFRALLEQPEPVGRRLDFLLQELGREANTVGAKSADASLSQLVIELKAELERCREQVQNVE
jgi:uncharacterized protein (TIGR00255 family)